MKLYQHIQETISKHSLAVLGVTLAPEHIIINDTLKEYEGDITVVIFPLIKHTKKSVEETANAIAQLLLIHSNIIEHFNIIKGFLNLSIKDNFWIETIHQALVEPTTSNKNILIEYSSPNTNKPIHLGHLRNNVLGYALSGIYQALGYNVRKVNLINDRGIHICKSMVAWQLFGNGETPTSSGMKGDHLVGKYYVAFDKQYKQEVEDLIAQGNSKEQAEKQAPILLAAQDLLRKWEQGDTKTVELWKTMNGWVYDGFEVTYKNLGVNFDHYYYESNTYLLGKQIVEEGLQRGVFYKREDGSVWIDLTKDGLDEKLVLRADGTSVYITQDIGTADLKYADFNMDTSIYVVGNEQDYHFKVLKLIMQKLGRVYANGIYHFSYGMVDLPSGKMKSREGTVVDADDLMEEMIATAKEQTNALGKIDDFSESEKQELFEIIGIGALKFFLLKVDPKKRILFNPQESIDLNGYTATFVQYTYARTKSILRKTNIDLDTIDINSKTFSIEKSERDLLKKLYQYQFTLEQSCDGLNPAKWIEYIYELAKSYNKFYNDCPILNCQDMVQQQFRLILTQQTGNAIQSGLAIVGIKVPERM